MENIQAYIFKINDVVLYGNCADGKGLVHATDFAIAENYAYEKGAQVVELNNSNAPDVMEEAVDEGCDGLIFIGPEGIAWFPFEIAAEGGEIPAAE